MDAASRPTHLNIPPFLRKFNYYTPQPKTWSLCLFYCADNYWLCMMLYANRSPRVCPLTPSGNTIRSGDSGKPFAHGCAYPPTSKVSNVRSLYYIYLLRTSTPESSRKTNFPFQRKTRSNNSAPQGKYLQQWVPNTWYSTPWETLDLGYILRPMHAKILLPHESDSYHSTSSPLSMQHSWEWPQGNRILQSCNGPIYYSYCIQENSAKEAHI